MSKRKKSENNIEGLRSLLFDTLERLLDTKDPMDFQQAKSIANVGRVIVDSAKLEVELIKKFGGTGSGFIPQSDHNKILAAETIS